MLKERIAEMNLDHHGEDFFVTKPQSLGEFFEAQDALHNLNITDDDKKDKLIDDLGSIFDNDIEPPPMKQEDSI